MYRVLLKKLRRSGAASTTFGDAVSSRLAAALPAWAALALGLAASLAIFLLVKALLEREARQRFEVVVAESASLIQKRIDSYNAVLYNARGFFNARGKVTRPEFNRYFKSLELAKLYPGMVTLNFARYVPAEERVAFEAEMRGDTSMDPAGYPALRIFPPGEDTHYLPLEFNEPLELPFVPRLLGGDVRRLGDKPADSAQALDNARDLNRLATSGLLFRLPLEPPVGLYIVRLPVYRPGMPLETVEQRRAAYRGSLGHGFVLDVMMRAALPEGVLQKLRIEIHDAGWSSALVGTPPTAANKLFDSDTLPAPPGAPPAQPRAEARFQQSAQVDMGGRKWLLRFSDHTSPSLAERTLLWGSLAAGVLLSALLYGLVRSVTGARQRALRAVAGILHDINQPLGAVTLLSNNAERLLQKGRTGEVRSNLGLIVDMAERMARIVGQLRSFARDDDGADLLLKAVSVREAMANAVLLVEAEARSRGVVIEMAEAQPALRVVADAVRLEQVLLNLLRNAIDALATSARKTIQLAVGAEADWVTVSVRDSGPGIEADAIGRVFEPFYTTKPVGKGMGLGLAMSRAAVRQFGGDLRAGNRPEGGAWFDVILKRAPA